MEEVSRPNWVAEDAAYANNTVLFKQLTDIMIEDLVQVQKVVTGPVDYEENADKLIITWDRGWGPGMEERGVLTLVESSEPHINFYRGQSGPQSLLWIISAQWEPATGQGSIEIRRNSTESQPEMTILHADLWKVSQLILSPWFFG